MQLIYGGRDESDYFDDLWAYDLEFKSWERWLERGSAGPMGRDHHAAVVVGNQFIIYGGWPASSRHLHPTASQTAVILFILDA